jgi:hypothetical protein
VPQGDPPADGEPIVGDGAVEHPEVGDIDAAARAGVAPGEPKGGDPAGLAGIALGDDDQAVAGGSGLVGVETGHRVRASGGENGGRSGPGRQFSTPWRVSQATFDNAPYRR